MIRCLVSGTLHADPQARASARAEGQRRTSRSDRQPAPAGADGGTPFDDLEDWQP